MKKGLKIIISVIVVALVIILAVVFKNKALNKIDLDNDFGSITYTYSNNGEETTIIMNSNHEWVYKMNNSEDTITQKTLTDTEYNEFKGVLVNSGITKLSKSLGKEGNGTHESIKISLLNGETFETSGYGIENQEFRSVVEALLKYNN